MVIDTIIISIIQFDANLVISQISRAMARWWLQWSWSTSIRSNILLFFCHVPSMRISINHHNLYLTGFSLRAENPCESPQRDMVSCPRSPPWGAWVSICLLKGRTCFDFLSGSLGSPAPTLAKGSSLKKK